MYFNRKNAEQKNWRMIKKGKHFLFGCSLVFALGAALVAPSVKADTVGTKPVAAEENVTYAAPTVEVASAAVAEEKVEKTVETTQNSKEKTVETTQNSKEEVVAATEKAKEADSIQAPEVTVVYNPAALTDEEKAKVVAAVKAANPTATDVQVQADGTAVVTFADGSRANLTAAQTIKDGSQVAKRRRARATVAAPVITSNLDGKGSSATDVTVQAPAGSTVKLYNTDGVVIGQAVANAQGVATVTPTNSLPVGEITATATPAGGSESPKSAPVTATRPTLTTVEGGVSRGNDSDNTQLLVTKSHITVYPGESVKVGVTAVSNKLENFSVPNNPAGVKGLLPRGAFLKSGGTGEPVTRRDNGYGGTVAWDQPAGDTVVTFSATSKNKVTVTRDLRVTVLELTKKLDAVPGEKVEVADLNNLSEDEKNKIIAATKKANASFPPGTLYNVDQRGNLVITYPDKSTDKIDASYLVTPSNKPADPNKPAGQAPEITSNLDGKASTPTDVTVKAEPGSTVKLYNNDGVVIGEAVANDQGIATISPINSLPEGQITATATPAGGSESPKSTPITATRAEKPEVGGGVSRGGDNTQLLVTKSHITVYPGETVNIGVTAASNAIEKFWVPGNAVSVKGLKPTGVYLTTSGSDTIKRRDNGYGGTVAWDQPAGDTVVTFEVQSKQNKVIVRRELRVTVLELTKKLDAVAGEKVEVADPNNVSEDEKNKIIDATKKANASFPPGTTYSVDEKGNLVITYPDGSTDKIAAAYLVTPAPKEADKYTPTAKAQTVAPGSTPDAKNSINNTGELPSGTTFAYKTPVDTATKGEKDAIVVVTYPDKSTDEVPVKVTVKDPRSDADKNDPKAKAQDIYKGSTPDAKGSIDNADELPYGTSFAYKTPVDTTTPGKKDATVVVTYPDGSKDEVPVKVTVEDPDKTSDAEKNTPTAKDQTVKVGEKPKAEASIGNFDKLPKGTTVEFKKPVDTTTPGEKDAIVVVTYPDTLTYEVPVKVTVKDPRSDADKNDPKAKAQTVAPGSTPEAKNSIGNVSDLPSGTTFAFKTPVDTATEGEKDATVVVTYPDGSKDEVPVKVTVKTPTTPTQPAITTDLTGKAGTKTPVEVTAEPGSKVEMYDKNGNKIGEATTGADGKATITPTVDIPEGNVTVVASKDGQTPEASDPVQATTAKDPSVPATPTRPAITTDLTGKAGTKTPVEVTAEPGTTVELFDKDGKKIGEATTGADGKAIITPTVDIPEGNVTAKATKDGQTSVPSESATATVATPATPTQPAITTDLTGKAGTKTPVEVTAEPGSKVEMYDKDGNKIGEATTGADGKATITPTVDIPEGNVTVVASKDGQTPEASDPVQATKVSDKELKTPALTPVVKPSALTDAEKAKVADEVKKANPTASKVEVGNDGTATVTFPDGSVAVLTPAKTVKEADSNGVKTPALTPVVNPSALTNAEKAKVADEVKKANPTASKVEVGNDGTATVTFPDGSVAVIAGENTVKKATKESATNQSAKKAGAKELPNTGTEQSNASLGLALLAAATGGLLFAKKRKEEE